MWKKYIALGDSITEGYGDSEERTGGKGWVGRFADSLRLIEPELEHVNLGVRGSTSLDVINNQLAPALQQQPDLISLTVGANDDREPEWTEETFEKEFEKILKTISETEGTVLVTAYPDTRTAYKNGGHEIPKPWLFYFQRLLTSNHIIRSLCKKYGAVLIDLEPSNLSLDPALLSHDLVHPNALGYTYGSDITKAVIAERFNITWPDQVETA